jgi:hypothetical protein
LSKFLLIGFFSTVGDTDCLQVVKAMLDRAGKTYDVAAYSDTIGRSLEGSISLRSANPRNYEGLVVICGPCWPGVFSQFGFDIAKFASCKRIGVNLTMLRPLHEWNPFHVLIERDSNQLTRADLSFLAPAMTRDVVGLCLVDKQDEYKDRQQLSLASSIARDLISQVGAVAVKIDTRWPVTRNESSLANASEVLSVMAKMDVIITNRLHGLVFALKAGVPAIAIDGISGGGKVLAQAKVLGWPMALGVDDASPDRLMEMYLWCRSQDGKSAAANAAETARGSLENVEALFNEAVKGDFEEAPVPAEPELPFEIKTRRVVGAVLRRLGLRR